VVHSVARKTRSLDPSPVDRALVAYFLGERAALLAMAPSLAPGCELSSVHPVVDSGAAAGGKVSFGDVRYRARDDQTLTLMLEFLRTLLAASSVGAALDRLRDTVPRFEERDVVLAIESLHRAGHVALT